MRCGGCEWHGGRYTTQDVDGARKVAPLGTTVLENLFFGGDPVGKVIRIRAAPFTVVRTLVAKAAVADGAGSGRCDSDSDHDGEVEGAGDEPGELCGDGFDSDAGEGGADEGR